ncbi:MAG: MarR family [Thermoplasmatales archaeon]|jgi:uncharacterized membrane protein|nr:MarR family [Thermoplasmatales archaeon]
MGTHKKLYHIVQLILLLSFLLIIFEPSFQAAEFYADLTIRVDPSGFVTIEGVTNYQNLTIQNTEQYTSKQQSYWLLNITKTETFSEFVYDLLLPKGSSINYIKTSGSIRIEENLGGLLIKGFGENESLSILIQYQTEKQDESFLQENMIFILLLTAILLVSLLIIYFYSKEKKTKETTQVTAARAPQINLKGLNIRQQQILHLLQEKNVPMTQTDIQKELRIPKASVSRNIHGLERKGLIEKEQIGMSNLIRLKKQ